MEGSFYFIAVCYVFLILPDYFCTIASDGQAAAQAPQSMQLSASIT